MFEVQLHERSTLPKYGERGLLFHRIYFGDTKSFLLLYHTMFTIRCSLARISGVRGKRGRVVEGNSLENCRTRKGIRGSNPLASAEMSLLG
jgi:hypothetical protein